MKYWWLSLIIAFICATSIFLTVRMRNNRKIALKVLFAVSTVLLSYKICEFIYYRIAGIPKYPVEFSHISYFIVGVAVCFGVKQMRPFAGICSLLSGIGYIVTAIFSPDTFVNNSDSVYYIVLGVVQHELLFFTGCLLLFDIDKYSIKNIWVPIVGIAIMVLFSIMVYNRIIYPDYDERDEMIIYHIVTGMILSYVMPAEKITMALRVITALGIGLLAIGLLCAFYFVNKKYYERKERKGIEIEGKDLEMGVFYWIGQKIKKDQEKKLNG
ncbi:MAG: YwaF family protein [Clostridiales bacterium]|nr:YwaF family protein [Clostridiales bacterium]